MDNNNYVIDGQHRYECITYLYTEGNDFSVPVSLITISVEELDEMYRINSNKPVPIINDFQEWKTLPNILKRNCYQIVENTYPHQKDHKFQILIQILLLNI